MPSTNPSATHAADALSRPISALFWWGLPLVMGWSSDLLKPPPPFGALVWSFALAWMGLGCALNARRCHRLHCYIAAPILFAGAAAVALIAMGLIPVGPAAVSYVIDGALGLALLSFAAEFVFGRYLPR
jgi:hypothetical protein